MIDETLTYRVRLPSEGQTKRTIATIYNCVFADEFSCDPTLQATYRCTNKSCFVWATVVHFKCADKTAKHVPPELTCPHCEQEMKFECYKRVVELVPVEPPGDEQHEHTTAIAEIQPSAAIDPEQRASDEPAEEAAESGSAKLWLSLPVRARDQTAVACGRGRPKTTSV